MQLARNAALLLLQRDMRGQPELLQLLFGAPQRLFRPDTCGDIAQDHRKQVLAILGVVGNRSLDGKFFAVGAQCHQHRSAAHAARCHAGLTEALDMRAVTLAKPLRDELVQRQPDYCLTRPAKSLLRCCVEQDNPLIAVHRNDRVHGGFNDIADAGLDASQRAISTLPLSYLAIEQDHGEYSCQRPRNTRGDEHLGPVPAE